MSDLYEYGQLTKGVTYALYIKGNQVREKDLEILIKKLQVTKETFTTPEEEKKNNP